MISDLRLPFSAVPSFLLTRLFRTFGLSFSLVIAAKLGMAGVIYDNGAPDDYHGSEMTHWIESDNFVLNTPTRLEGLTFWDFEIIGYYSGTIVWQIYSDNGGGVPGALLFSGAARNVSHTATGIVAFSSFHEYLTTADIGPVSLPAGAYWIALHNGDFSNGQTGTYQDWNFYWIATANTTNPASQSKMAPYNGQWDTNANPTLPSDLAFKLSGVSAPPTLTVTIENNSAQLKFTGAVGYNFSVEYRDSLSNSSWTALPGADRVAGTGDVIQLADENIGSEPHRFYRVTLLYDGIGTPVVTAFKLASTTPQVSFTTSNGYFYRLEYKNDLGDLSWTPVAGAETILGTGNIVQVSDSDPDLANHPRRFYRAALQ